MISINNIAAEMQTILGDAFRLYVDNNTSDYYDIKKRTTINKQIVEQDNHIKGIITTTSSPVVALKDLFSTSFGYAINFIVPTKTNIETDLNGLISALNGVLNIVGVDKYLITFNTPTALGQAEGSNGEYWQSILLSGSIAITNGSTFGNELEVTIDTHDLTKVMLSADFNLSAEMIPPEAGGDDLTPFLEYKMIRNIATFVFHARKDHPLIINLIDTQLSGGSLLLSKIYTINFLSSAGDPEWSTKLIGLNTVYSIGGYVIINATFEKARVVV